LHAVWQRRAARVAPPSATLHPDSLAPARPLGPSPRPLPSPPPRGFLAPVSLLATFLGNPTLALAHSPFFHLPRTPLADVTFFFSPISPLFSCTHFLIIVLILRRVPGRARRRAPARLALPDSRLRSSGPLIQCLYLSKNTPTDIPPIYSLLCPL